MDGVGKIERCDKLGQIVGVRVQIIAVPRLAGPAMAAAVMGDAAIALLRQKEHLVFKGVRAERPAMAENDRSTSSPIVVVYFRPVLCREVARTIPDRCRCMLIPAGLSLLLGTPRWCGQQGRNTHACAGEQYVSTGNRSIGPIYVHGTLLFNNGLCQLPDCAAR
jgi:hypothetical protein